MVLKQLLPIMKAKVRSDLQNKINDLFVLKHNFGEICFKMSV